MASRLQGFLRRHTGLTVALLASLLATALIWGLAAFQVRQYEKAQLDRRVDLTRRLLLDRMQRYEETLTTIRSAYQTFGNWKDLSHSLAKQDLPPGLQFIAIVEAGPDGRSAKFSTDSSLVIGGAGLGGGKQLDLAGWVSSSDSFREAAERARESGRMAASGKAQLPSKAGVGAAGQPGFFLVLPVSQEQRTGPPGGGTPIRAWLAGFVAAGELVASSKGFHEPAFAIRLYDAPEPAPDSLLFDSTRGNDGPGRESAAGLSRSASIPVAGRIWTLSAGAPGGLNLPLSRDLATRLFLFNIAVIALLLGVALVVDRDRKQIRKNADAWARRFAETEARLDAEYERGETALRESQERFSLAARAALDGLWDWNLTNNSIHLSPRWKALLGFDEHELSNDPDEWLDRVHPEDRARFLAKLADHLENRTPRFESEHRILHRNGSYRWMLTRGLAARDGRGKARRIAGSQTDITASRQAEKRLLQAALHDPLTGLPNRSYFMERLASAGRKARKQPKNRFALLFLDVDRFKAVNDSLGHIVGDELLASIGRRLKTCLRPADTIARLGGDEFAILLEKLNKDIEATVIAERIQKELARPFRIGTQEVYTAVSIGITFGSAGHARSEDLMRNADTAMYRAKAQGKARYALFDQAMHTDSAERLHLESDLRRGLERQEFLIHYQPIVSLSTGRIIGCEALIRWQHPERGLVLPNDFIPVAEETGLIIPISEWLLETACRQMMEWQEAGLPPIQLSVNISPSQFSRQDVFHVVNRALVNSKLDPSLLQLELTESALMENADATIRPLVELYGKGVQISLDDFGTGYSSLMYLRRFPIGTLKISESFIGQIMTNPGDAAIASGLIALAHSLDLSVIVEGVETPEQLAFLQSKNCEAVQGHVISPPLDTKRFAILLEQWRGLSVSASA